MPNPKRRHSQKRTSTRRAHDALKSHSLSECPNCHEKKMPHRACSKCGYYKGRDVLQVEEATKVPATMPSVIALDAMGSDRAPKPEVEGAIHAARNYGVRVLLIGPEATIKAELDRHPSASRLPLEIVHASEVISMEDKAVQAVRAEARLLHARRLAAGA